MRAHRVSMLLMMALFIGLALAACGGQVGGQTDGIPRGELTDDSQAGENLSGYELSKPTPLPTEEEPTDAGEQAPGAAGAVDLSSGVPVPFTGLVQGDVYAATIEQPALFVAGDAAGASAFTAWIEELDPALAEPVAAVDYATHLVAAAFAGRVGSSGYSITVQQVLVANGEVWLAAALGEPDPEAMTASVISYPYQIIQIGRDDLPADPGTPWKLVDTDGQILAEITYP